MTKVGQVKSGPHSAENVLDPDSKRSWLPQTKKEQVFTMSLGPCNLNISGFVLRNSKHIKRFGTLMKVATKAFKVSGSKDMKNWDQLSEGKLVDPFSVVPAFLGHNPKEQFFFFDEIVEVRFLKFEIVEHWHDGGGLEYFSALTPEETNSMCNESQWPDLDEAIKPNASCGSCKVSFRYERVNQVLFLFISKVLVDKMTSNYKTCSNYCSSMGRGCQGAWEEVADTCEVEASQARFILPCAPNCTPLESCEERFDWSSDAICECSPLGWTPQPTTTENSVFTTTEPSPTMISSVDPLPSTTTKKTTTKITTTSKEATTPPHTTSNLAATTGSKLL